LRGFFFDYTGTASIMLSGHCVGTILVSLNPAASKSARYSSLVRSRPFAKTSAWMSLIFAKSGLLPGCITASATRTLPCLGTLSRQFLRIATARESSHSWRMVTRIYASPPTGTDSKKFPGTSSQRSATSSCSIVSVAPSMVEGRSKTTPCR